MLVLGRTLGQKIVIDGSITLTIVRLSKGRVSIGIEAPPEVAIDRPEAKPEHRRLVASDGPTSPPPGDLLSER